jgi:hypothetical protein
LEKEAVSEIVLLEYISATSGNPMHVVAERSIWWKHTQFRFINSNGDKILFLMVDGTTTLEQQRNRKKRLDINGITTFYEGHCFMKVGTFVRCHGWVGEKPPSPGVPHRKKKDVEEGEGWVV